MVIALTGASSALAGLILVFVGILVAAYQPLIGNASTSVLRRFRIASLLGLGAFGLSMLSVILDASWLIAAGGHCFYVAVIVVFFIQLAALIAIALYAMIGVLLKG